MIILVHLLQIYETMRKIRLIFVIGLLGLIHCKKANENTNPMTEYYIDGVKKTPVDVTINVVNKNDTWNIRFADAPADTVFNENAFLIISDFGISTVTETTYNINGLEDPMGYNGFYNYDFYAETPFCNTSDIVGNLTITSMDQSNQTMSGTFNMTICDQSSVSHEITQGIFTDIPY